MTEQQLVRALIEAGLITQVQVQTAELLRDEQRNLAQVVVDMGWVAPEDVLKIDPTLTLNANGSSAGPSAPRESTALVPTPKRRDIDRLSGDGQGATATDGSDGRASTSHIMGLGQETPPPMDDSGVLLAGEAEHIEDPMMSTTVKFCNEIILKAVEVRASDVHLEPRANGLMPRFRIDGLLRSGKLLPREMQAPIVSRIKVMARLNITETRLSQDGRFRALVGGRLFDFRVSTLPGLHGEKVVMRLLDHSTLITDLTRLGFTTQARAAFEEMLDRSHGMILVTGPTGSGKSTTLYAALAATLDETKNVVTVEDPIEYELEGVMQTQTHAEIGLTFASRLRSILRQDPDVILVGEIRDSETADMAIRAALTGHLVLSTLHTTSAVTAVTRLQDMGVPPFLIASSLSGVVAQRLVRLICRQCRCPVPRESEEYEMALAQLRLSPGTPMYHGAGCAACNGTGLRGRVALVEMLNVDQKIRRAIMDRVDADSLQRIAVQSGMRTLYQDGLDKLQRGITTAYEVARALLGAEDEEIETTPE